MANVMESMIKHMAHFFTRVDGYNTDKMGVLKDWSDCDRQRVQLNSDRYKDEKLHNPTNVDCLTFLVQIDLNHTQMFEAMHLLRDDDLKCEFVAWPNNVLKMEWLQFEMPK
jgi:hypothetical protein